MSTDLGYSDLRDGLLPLMIGATVLFFGAFHVAGSWLLADLAVTIGGLVAFVA